ncbi:hypothetical protein F2Q69_00037676 [Brassica cretica]|uniref:Uncharacterized protein n=1 Tax=Brassica cretica TaxID=69181 RepID=A0A8S9SL85_BRACR|nr:hypothetical protein F2Q69_00037676 [Brassica cretica]
MVPPATERRNKSSDPGPVPNVLRIKSSPFTAPDSRPSRTRARSLCSDRAVRVLGRYVATELGSSSVATERPSLARVRSLRSDRAMRVLGRYVATELGLSLVATDRDWLVRGPIAILELVRGWFEYVSVALGQPGLEMPLGISGMSNSSKLIS